MTSAITLLNAAGLVAGLLIVAGCNSPSNIATRDTVSAATPIYVRVVPIERTLTGLPVPAVGKLEVKEELRLSFKIGGIIEKVFVDEGQTVHKGQLLATLSLTEIDAQLTQAQNGFDKADRDLNRVKNLFADTVATLEQLQNATTAWEMARAGLDAAAFNRKYAEIYAPTDGRVLQRLGGDHEQVAAGTPVIVMADYGRGWVVRTGLADRDFMRVNLNDTATVIFDALPGMIFSGSISQIAAAPNQVSGTYEIEIKLRSPRDRLVSGLVGKVSIMPITKKAATLVPIEALVEADGLRGFVFAPAPDQKSARKLPVTISYMHNGRVGIDDTLAGITSVITSGATKLTDGAPVAIVR